MSAYRQAKLKWNVMAYGGGILFGAALMGFWIVAMQLHELVKP